MKWLIVIFIVVYCALIRCDRVLCQVTEEWRMEYIGPESSDNPTSMVIDDYGNIYVTGSSHNTNNSIDFATVKYNTGGIQQWSARYSSPPNRVAIAYSVATDRFGNAYVTGSAPAGNTDKYTTIKYNQSGVQCWLRIYYGESPGSNIPHSISTDYFANVYITGFSYFDITGLDYTTIKYDSSGIQQWVARYRNPGEDRANCVKVDNSGNVYVTGYCRSDTTYYNDIVTVKYNSSGVQQWAVRYNGPGNRGDSADAMAVDNYGNVYVTGTSWGGDSTGYDYITIKYNQSGVQQWAARYNAPDNRDDIARSIAVDDSGNVYVTGDTHTLTYNVHFATVKYNASGVQQWVAIYNYQGGDFPCSLTLDRQGYIYVTGTSWEGIRCHFATVKYSSSGVQQWVARTYSQINESPIGVKVDSLYNVYVAGGNGHYLTIKYNQLTGVEPVSNEIPGEFKLYQNYPNPFNPVTTIKFNVRTPLNPPFRKGETEQLVKLVVFDILGREVAILVNQEMKPGSYEVKFDGSNYASGLYLYRIEAGSFVEVKKMVLIK